MAVETFNLFEAFRVESRLRPLFNATGKVNSLTFPVFFVFTLGSSGV